MLASGRFALVLLDHKSCPQQASYLLPGQNDRQVAWFFGPLYLFEFARTFLQYLFIEKDNGIERLILCRSCDMRVAGKMSEEQADFGFAHPAGMAFIMKADKPIDPVNICFFCFQAVMLYTQNIANLIE
jgi:hypothetical protein